MVIDQRNNGASVSGSGFSVDRFYNAFTSTNATQQRSTVVPAGFTNSLLVTITTATAPGTSSLAYVSQTIEGFNTSDFDLGKATAATFTLSFWVRSSLTGTYAVGFLNGAQDRSYVATYSISVANTWEYKTITVAGDTAGTWLTNNGKGLCIFWDLGSGSNYQATAGSWQAGTLIRTSGSVNFANTLGATFYITGVQLEKGSTATSFDYRPYTMELQLCQRYFQKYTGALQGSWGATTITYQMYLYPVVMRAAPTWNYSNIGYSAASSLSTNSSTASLLRVALTITAGGGYGYSTFDMETSGAEL
jgi:hypothetical protein